METKWTPSPWLAAPTGNTMANEYSQPFGICSIERQTLVAGVFGDVAGGREVANANAHLIAAAPMLYERLSRLIDNVETGSYESTGQAIREAKDALSRARGEAK